MFSYRKRLAVLLTTAVAAVIAAVILVTLVFPGLLQRSRAEQLKAEVKRDLFYGLQSGDFTRLKESAEAAAGNYRSEIVFWAALIYAESKLGNYETARTLGKKHLDSPEYDSLLSAVYLAGDTADTDDRNKSRSSLILSEYDSTDPVVYERIARLMPDSRLTVNAALLWAAGGNMDKAYALVRDAGPASLYPLLPFYFAVDAGSYADALSILAAKRDSEDVSSAEADMLEGDVLLRLKKREKAREVYSAYLDGLQPPTSVPYINSAWIAAQAGDYEQAIGSIEAAISRFSGEKRLFLPYAAYLYQGDRKDEALEVVNRFLELYPGEPSAVLYSLTMPELIGNQARHEATLWQLLSAHPEYIPAARYFAAYCFREKKYDDLRTLLSRYGENPASAEWISCLEGCAAAVSGDLRAAEELFLHALSVKERWETHYNLALVKSSLRDYAGALEHFQKAAGMLPVREGSSISAERSLIRTGIAGLMAEQGNPEGAVRELLYALELDPDNFRARLLLKKLKGR